MRAEVVRVGACLGYAASMSAARASEVASYLRQSKDAIATEWAAEVTRSLAELRQLSTPALIDHLPELIDGLAAWIEGRDADARAGFRALTDGHALQRLGFGVDGETLAVEYSRLRHVILRHLLHVPSSPAVREDLIRFDAGLDLAVNESMRVYAQRRDLVRERFIAILAHDLRSPLNAITMSVEAMTENGALPAPSVSLAARITRAAQRMARMIDSVTEFARGHLGGGIPATVLPEDMARMCQAAADELRAGFPQHQIVVECSGDLTGSWDADRVQQALVNLLSNGAQYGNGTVTLRAWESPDRRHVLTSVTNLGPPIPVEALPTLFDPFARGTRSSRHGLGLGLFIVQQIALAHGARCAVDSTDASTTFTITWPRTPLEETPHRPSRVQGSPER